MDLEWERSERRLTIFQAESRINLKPELIGTAEAVPFPVLLTLQHLVCLYPRCLK
jgi:hypothetical protein